MLMTILLMAASPVEVAGPIDTPQVVCKVVRDYALKSRRLIACATNAQWKAYRTAVQKNERDVITRGQSYAGVGSGY
jgi:hypothetical protein